MHSLVTLKRQLNEKRVLTDVKEEQLVGRFCSDVCVTEALVI